MSASDIAAPLQAAIAAVLDVVREAARVGDADAGERQALLPLEVRDLFGGAVPKCMRRPVRKAGLEQPRTS
jgi:hypothetical protein